MRGVARRRAARLGALASGEGRGTRVEAAPLAPARRDGTRAVVRSMLSAARAGAGRALAATVRRFVAARSLVLLLALAPAGAAAHPAALPAASFEDQEGRTLDLADLRGRVAVIVYGRRAGLDDHVRWGRRLDADLRARGVYRAEDAPETRPVQILALAQMGGIPDVFRPMLRGILRQHVERPHSLWLDWDDRMSAAFGARDAASTVVVVDPAGRVRLVVSGPPDGEPYRAVRDLLARLR